MGLRRAIIEKLQDVRLRDKFLADGRLSKEEKDRYLETLPDDADKLEVLDSANYEKERKRRPN